MTKISLFVLSLLVGFSFFSGCNSAHNTGATAEKETKATQTNILNYFNYAPRLQAVE